MVERPEHVRVLALLSALDADFLKQAACWFAGGTAISLRGGLPETAWDMARAAYGPSVDDAYTRAMKRLRDRVTWREHVFGVLALSAGAKAIVEAKLDTLLSPSTT